MPLGVWLLVMLVAIAALYPSTDGLAVDDRWRAGPRPAPATVRSAQRAISLLATLLLALLWLACGGSAPSSGRRNPGTAPGAYSLTVTGSTALVSANLSHSVNLSLTVN